MTPYEMEEQLKNLNERTTAIEQILPTLATRDDLRLTINALQHEIETGFQDAKDHATRLNEVTREQIRLVVEAMATKSDLQELRETMATKSDLQELRETMATKRDLQELRQTTKREFQALQRGLSKQISSLRAPRTKPR
jgi:hypothetical protein